MSLRPVRNFSRESSSPDASSPEVTPRMHHQPVPTAQRNDTLPPLLSHLRNEGIDASYRNPPPNSEAHKAALSRAWDSALGHGAARYSTSRSSASPPQANVWPSHRFVPAPNHAARTEYSRYYASDGEDAPPPLRTASDFFARPSLARHTSVIGREDSCSRHSYISSIFSRFEDQRAYSYSDTGSESRPTSSSSKRARAEHVHEHDIRMITDEDSDEEQSMDQNSYGNNQDCITDHSRTQTIEIGGGKTKNVYYNTKGVKLEIIKVEINHTDKQFMKFARPVPSDRGKWRCIYEKMDNGKPATCGYLSKKHLVKRHIEATHMNIKRFMCSWCRGTFTQRSNAENCHINVHSGESPHACSFCPERFKDPSKLHKHLARDHSDEFRQKRRRVATSSTRTHHHPSVSPHSDLKEEDA